MSFVIEDVLVRNDPTGRRLPVLFDSPHSGHVYPRDFHVTCSWSELRRAEDPHVEALFAAAPDHGATLLCALFPRSFIDVNRAVDDIDPNQIDGVWRTPLHPSGRSAMGIGLIRRMLRPGVPLYDGKLPAAAVAERIDRCYRPYHHQMHSVLDGLAARFGAVWHVNCHSMPSTLGPNAGDPRAADFVIGDRDGTTSDPAFVRLVAEILRGFGYWVTINDPYKGLELIGRYGDPARGRHSIQLEINQRLYMDERTLEPHAGFDRLKGEIEELIRRIAGHAEQGLMHRAAE